MSSPGKAKTGAGWPDSWHVNPSLNKDFDAIDGLRGVAILMVLVCHFFYMNPAATGATRFVGGVFFASWHGVTIFFALSGFLISHPFWKRKIRGAETIVPKGYAARRFWKIYPPLALSVILFAPLYYLKYAQPDTFLTAGQWLLGLPIVKPPLGFFNPVMWSLIVEAHFYIVLPLLFVAFRRFTAKQTLTLVFLCFLLIPTAVRWWNISQGVTVDFQPHIRVRFPSMLDAFAFGILLAGLENMGAIKRSWARFGDLGTILLVCTLLAMSWFNMHRFAPELIQSEVFSWLIKVSAALLLCYVADPNHPRSRLLSVGWLRWCGIISYEWYLVHQPLALWTRDVMGAAGGNPLKYMATIAIPFAASLLIAALVYRYFSLPILKFGRGRNVAGAA